MAMFWQSYLDMVQILFDFVKSILLPDWNLHLKVQKEYLSEFVHMIGLITQDILVTIGAVSKRLKINSQQFINNFNMETFPRGVQKENLIYFLIIRS